jgi:hypothetical protein
MGYPKMSNLFLCSNFWVNKSLSMMWTEENNLLCKADKILMVGVHVGKLTVDQHENLVFASLLLLSDVGSYDPFGLLSQTRVAIHL